ncbi:MAG TPA: tetratricopeptide repeat protein, partial [Ktedonobacteraceae bacterium]
EQLSAHLSPLRRARKLTNWFDRMILSGSDRELEVKKHLLEADLILLLISSDFIKSNYCYELQLTAALKHYEAGQVEIIPILLRPVLWEEDMPIKRLPLILPTSKVPVTLWPDRDEAFKNIATAIRDLIQAKLASKYSISVTNVPAFDQFGETVLVTRCPQCGTSNRIGANFCKNDGVDLLAERMIITPKPIPPLQSSEDWIKEGQLFAGQKRFADALVAYEQALLLNPRSASAHFYKGHVWYALQRYSEALDFYEQAIRFQPNAAAPYCHKGHALRHLKRNTDALNAYEQALQLGSREIKVAAYNGKGSVLTYQKRLADALDAYEKALQLDPGCAAAYYGKGCVYEMLGLKQEAQEAFEKAAFLGAAL